MNKPGRGGNNMKKAVSIFCVVSFIILVTLTVGLSAFAETVKCTECGMTCDVAAKFTSRIIQGDQTLYFCDIGDLFSYLQRKKPSVTRLEVKDYSTGEWIDAHKAYYVHSEKKFKTPMGWGIAPFRDKERASEFGTVMDFDATARALK
jgi:nitrous oxide reductase accessory protein NosL